MTIFKCEVGIVGCCCPSRELYMLFIIACEPILGFGKDDERRYICIGNHRLRGSASTVLTATGQVNGMANFDPSQNRNP